MKTRVHVSLLLLLLFLVPCVYAGWLGSIFSKLSGGNKQTTVTQASATLDACEAVLLQTQTNTATGGGDEGEAEGKLLSSSPPMRTTFKAQRSQSSHFEARGKGIHDFFMAKESRQHILNAENFQQINHNTFRCEMAPIQFFSSSIIPVVDIQLDIDADNGRVVIHAVSGKVKKSDKPINPEEAASNGYMHTGKGSFNELSFKMDTKNHVSWVCVGEDTHTRTYKVTSDLRMEVSMEKPGWLLVPNSMMNRVGSMVLQRVLKKSLPEFLDRIQTGYYEWAGAAKIV